MNLATIYNSSFYEIKQILDYQHNLLLLLEQIEILVDHQDNHYHIQWLIDIFYHQYILPMYIIYHIDIHNV